MHTAKEVGKKGINSLGRPAWPCLQEYYANTGALLRAAEVARASTGRQGPKVGARRPRRPPHPPCRVRTAAMNTTYLVCAAACMHACNLFGGPVSLLVTLQGGGGYVVREAAHAMQAAANSPGRPPRAVRTGPAAVAHVHTTRARHGRTCTQVGCSIVEAFGGSSGGSSSTSASGAPSVPPPRELDEVLRIEYRTKLLNPRCVCGGGAVLVVVVLLGGMSGGGGGGTNWVTKQELQPLYASALHVPCRASHPRCMLRLE